MHRIYIDLDQIESVNILMKNRSLWCPQTEQWRVTRTLPKYLRLYDRCVTGLKIKIDQSTNRNTIIRKLNELDLRKCFDRFGRILHCQWINEDRTEALFTFDESGSNKSIYSHSFLLF
jgi:hypothetical protein